MHHKKIRLTLRDHIIICKQLGFFLTSGSTLTECLELCSAPLPPKNQKRRLLERIRADNNAGIPLWQSLENNSSFSKSLLAVIEAGESSGTLAKAFERCGQELVKRDASRKKVGSALIYPACIALLALVLTGGMTFGIFPKIRPLLESMHTTLPLPTRVLIWISDTVTHHWIILLIIGIVGSISGLLLVRNEMGRTLVANRSGQFFVALPMVGTIFKDRVLSIFTGAMATLIAAGLPLPASLRRARPANITYAHAAENVRKNIETGEKMSQALAVYPRLFPETMIHLISAAEATGTLGETLTFLSDYFQNEYEELVKKWSSLLEPFLMVVMGCCVGFIALAMILPIYALSQSVSAIH